MNVKPFSSSRDGILRHLRTIRRRLASGALVLLGVVWLNMAVQPCLMAAEPLLPQHHHDSGCPHCPPADGHCGDQDSGRCVYIDAIDYDGRQAPAPDLDDIKLPLAQAVTAPAWSHGRQDRYAFAPVDSPPPPGGPPLFVTHCSFLK